MIVNWYDYLFFILILLQIKVDGNFIKLEVNSEDVTSPEFRLKAKNTYEKALDCISNGRPDFITNKSAFSFPLDAEEHYHDIQRKTSHFRRSRVHRYAGYGGPWIENHWIASFEKLPLSAFGGLIPIFAQWIDIEIISHPDYDHKRTELIAMMRPTVLYIAVSQGDKGINDLATRAQNVIILSAGGYGHIPIPLVKGIIPYTPPPNQFNYDISFFGAVHFSREQMLEQIKNETEKYQLKFLQGQGGDWKNVILESKFNLAPRGFGRSSFRYTEIIQLGRIPIFLHDFGQAWIPYLGTSIGIETFGFYAIRFSQDHGIEKMVAAVANVSTEDLNRRLEQVKLVREHYTYEGVLKQILLFMSDPFGPKGGHLRCMILPTTQN